MFIKGKMSGESDGIIARNNLLSIFKVTLKDLLDSCLPHHSCVNDENPYIKNLFVILQHVLCHALQERSSLTSRSVWNLIERASSRDREMHESVLSIREMNHIKTSLGKLRVWLNIALMQKKLSTYFDNILEQNILLREFYHTRSIMRTEDAMIISGLLSSLNFLDFVFINKDETFDTALQPINYSLFIESNMTIKEKQLDCDATNSGEEVKNWTDLVSQKRYLEELNISLSDRVNSLEKTLLDLTASNTLLKEELFESRKNVQALQKEMGGVEGEAYEAKRAYDCELKDKDAQINALRKQLEDVKAFNLIEISRNADLEDSVKHKEAVVARVEEKCQQLASTITSIEALNSQFQKENSSLREEGENLSQEVVAKETIIEKLKKEGEIERGKRGVLEALVEDGRLKIMELEKQLKSLPQLKKEIDRLQTQLKEFTRIKMDQELALEEIGSVLSQSKLQVDSLEEGGCDNVTWVEDDSVTHCSACNKPFSVSRRKHHCRRCGQIFCHDCSSQKAFLPNHSKPTRVCFSCYSSLQPVK